jgi:hypothetical protein|tara:strand:- start:180 stop:356 length:177 start_codon:yes stop_codon:yes gene_type:complete
MIRRVDPVAKSMAHNRRRTSTRVIPDKREQDKEKRDNKEMRDAWQSEYRKVQGKETTE